MDKLCIFEREQPCTNCEMCKHHEERADAIISMLEPEQMCGHTPDQNAAHCIRCGYCYGNLEPDREVL